MSISLCNVCRTEWSQSTTGVSLRHIYIYTTCMTFPSLSQGDIKRNPFSLASYHAIEFYATASWCSNITALHWLIRMCSRSGETNPTTSLRSPFLRQLTKRDHSQKCPSQPRTLYSRQWDFDGIGMYWMFFELLFSWSTVLHMLSTEPHTQSKALLIGTANFVQHAICPK